MLYPIKRDALHETGRTDGTTCPGHTQRHPPRLGAAAEASILVTGSTAAAIDVSDRLSASLLPFSAVVVGLALILLLLLVFRSIVVPVEAAVGFLLSVGAAFGAVVAVFQWGWLAGLLSVLTTGPEPGVETARR